MDFGKAFSFVFEDEDWIKKIGVGGLISLIPFIGVFLVLGWGLEITKRVIKKDEEVLPDWSDFGGYLTRGFIGFLIALVYMIPVILLVICSLTPLLFENIGDTLRYLTFTVITCFGFFALIYMIAISMLLPAALANYAMTDEIGAAFKFSVIIKMVRGNLGAYGMVLLGGLMAGLVSGLGVIACGIGVLMTSVYSFAINGHLWGQAYKVSISGAVTDSSKPLPAAD